MKTHEVAIGFYNNGWQYRIVGKYTLYGARRKFNAMKKTGNIVSYYPIKISVREQIKEQIEAGNLHCHECPQQGVLEGVFEGDIEMSKICVDCIHGPNTNKTDRLISAIGEDRLSFLIK